MRWDNSISFKVVGYFKTSLNKEAIAVRLESRHRSPKRVSCLLRFVNVNDGLVVVSGIPLSSTTKLDPLMRRANRRSTLMFDALWFAHAPQLVLYHTRIE